MALNALGDNGRRLRIRPLVVALLLAVVASACADDDEQDAGGQAPTTQAEQPVRGGTLVVALEQDPGSLNPAVSSNGAIHNASEPMFNGLVGVDTDGNLTGELAERWTVEEGGRLYRFTLRDGLKWHDGRPITSDDVKFTFDNALLKFHSRTRASLGNATPSIETPDPRTVLFRFAQPYAPLLSQMNVTEAPIIPKHVYEGCGADIDKVANCAPNKAPVGSGPFKFVSYENNEVRLTRNPDYFRPGLPYFENMVLRVVDQSTRTLALQRKEVDWLYTVQPASDLLPLRNDQSITLAEAARGPGGGNCVLTIAFNMKPPEGRPPIFNDLRMRQALWAATNRPQAAEQILFGQGRVAPQPIHTAIAVARAQGLTLPSFDLNRARQLLDQIGWKDEGGGIRVARGVPGVEDGAPLKIDIQHFSGQQAEFAQVLRQQWRVVGVDLETKEMTNQALPTSVFTNRTFDTATISYCNESDPQIGVRRQYHSTQIGTVAFSNAAGYSDPEMDALWNQSTSEVDPAKRTQLFQRIQEKAVRDLPYIWMAETLNTRAYNAVCTGFNIQNTGLFAEGAYCKR